MIPGSVSYRFVEWVGVDFAFFVYVLLSMALGCLLACLVSYLSKRDSGAAQFLGLFLCIPVVFLTIGAPVAGRSLVGSYDSIPLNDVEVRQLGTKLLDENDRAVVERIVSRRGHLVRKDLREIDYLLEMDREERRVKGLLQQPSSASVPEVLSRGVAPKT